VTEPIRYYKATCPDGTDFRTGTVDYGAALITGDVVTHPSVKQVKDDPGTYLSVSVSPTDCTGMKWPCRLFLVQPVGRALTAGDDLPSKRRLSRLRVTEELPAHEAFGPQGEQVAALVERAGRLTFAEGQAFAARYAARNAARNAAIDAARYAAIDAAIDAARYAAIDAARNAAWYAAWYAAWDAAWYAAIDAARYAAIDAARYAARDAARYAARNAAIDAARDAAWYAAWDAAWALVVKDLITPKQFDTLYGPWASVCGGPS
jgi:hypothetical protein